MQSARREISPHDVDRDLDYDTLAFESPPTAFQSSFQYDASLPLINTTAPQALSTIESAHIHSPYSSGLRLQTDVLDKFQSQSSSVSADAIPSTEPQLQQPLTSGLPYRSSSVRSALSASHFTGGSLSPASAMSSPGLGPMVDITPLPSPITRWGSPRSWTRSVDNQEERDTLPKIAEASTPMTPSRELLGLVRTSPKKRRIHAGLVSSTNGAVGKETHIYDVNASSHARNRSISDYTPSPAQVLLNRHIGVSGTGPSLAEQPFLPPIQHMHREEYLAIQRGLISSGLTPPTPPTSNRGRDASDLESEPSSPGGRQRGLPLRYEARTVRDGKLRHYRAVRQLGKGTFSNVMLAINQSAGTEATSNQSVDILQDSCKERPTNIKSLVAVKICDFGPAGGADEKKVETSLKRELEILKAIDHPSLVHLKAYSMLDRRAFLVLNYCAGGDLFELANLKPELLVPSLIRRIFTELIAAVRYLHAQYIVHRDIKLESLFVLTVTLIMIFDS